jgi:hypothetical protein
MKSKLFTEETARFAIDDRMRELEDPDVMCHRTIPELAKLFWEIGYCPRVPSRTTMNNLLSGKMFPHLTDREGRPIDWSKIPAAPVGTNTGSSKGKSLAQQVQLLTSRLDVVEQRLASFIYSHK